MLIHKYKGAYVYHTHIWRCICIYAHMDVHMAVYMHINTYECIYTSRHIYMCICIYTYGCVSCTHMEVFLHTHMEVYMLTVISRAYV